MIGLVPHASDGGGQGRRDVGVVREGRRVRRGNMLEYQRRIREGGEAVLRSGGFERIRRSGVATMQVPHCGGQGWRLRS